MLVQGAEEDGGGGDANKVCESCMLHPSIFLIVVPAHHHPYHPLPIIINIYIFAQIVGNSGHRVRVGGRNAGKNLHGCRCIHWGDQTY